MKYYIFYPLFSGFVIIVITQTIFYKQTDDEWDAILGELSVLESQFDNELYSNLGKTQQNGSSNHDSKQKVLIML